MLTGEVGAGKHNLTQLYHALCGRTGEFVRLDYSSLVEVRQTSVLLFGHEKDVRHQSRNDGGLLEKAKGGTIMLENVDCMSEFAQRMLLPVLQGNTYKPYEGLCEKPADVMFVATMNSLLDIDNLLRLDFLHYLRNKEVSVPLLRECLEDIIPLAEFFVTLFAKGKYLSAEAKSLLMSHKWSGNVHELKVAVQDAVSRSLANRILADDFDLGCPMNEPAVHDAGALRKDEYMNLRIRHILNHAKGLNDAVREFGKSKVPVYS